MALNQNPSPKPSHHKTAHNQSNPAPKPRLGKPQPQRQVIKEKRTAIAKRVYKVRVLNQPMPTTATLMTTTIATQTQTTGLTATVIPVIVHKLATGHFSEAPCPMVRSSVQNPPPLKDIPKAPVRQGTPWPNKGSTSENLFETGKDWPISPTLAPASVPTVKTEAPPQVAAIPKAVVTPRQAAKNCTWGPHCLIFNNEEEHGEEDWDGNLQNPPRMLPQNIHQPQPQSYLHPQPQHPQPQNVQQNTQCPQPQNLQHLQP